MIDRIIARLPGWAKTPTEILVGAAKEFGQDRSSRMSAAIAYRTVFALAPLLMILVAVLGAFLGSRAEAQVEILDAVDAVAGRDVRDTIGSVISSATASADTAAVIGGILLLWTASGLFLEMQRNLNDIFDVSGEEVSGILGMLRTRGIAFLWALGLGLLLILTWGLNAVWRFIGDLLPDSMARVHQVVGILAPVASLVLLSLVFALVFQTMTAATVRWRAVSIGGLFTSIVFIAAAYGVGVFFESAGRPTALGFTGSLVAIIFLAYFLASVFHFGAQVTKVYADRLEERDAESRRDPRFGDDLRVVVSEPPVGVPRAALAAFLAGLAVGWRRGRR